MALKATTNLLAPNERFYPKRLKWLPSLIQTGLHVNQLHLNRWGNMRLRFRFLFFALHLLNEMTMVQVQDVYLTQSLIIEAVCRVKSPPINLSKSSCEGKQLSEIS